MVGSTNNIEPQFKSFLKFGEGDLKDNIWTYFNGD